MPQAAASLWVQLPSWMLSGAQGEVWPVLQVLWGPACSACRQTQRLDLAGYAWLLSAQVLAPARPACLCALRSARQASHSACRQPGASQVMT